MFGPVEHVQVYAHESRVDLQSELGARGAHWWPTDAWVSVYVKPKQWQRTITQHTTDVDTAERWLREEGESRWSRLYPHANEKYGEVVEL